MNLSDEYDNRALVPDHPRIISSWHADAAAYREQANYEPDIAYGAKPRMALDVFHPGRDIGGPLIVFIHGGYWRVFDKSMFSHIAAGTNAHGLSVAVPSYTLCPEVTVPDIIDELRQCCLFLRNKYGRRLIVAGHSAGGHLAACMVATDWEQFGGAPDLVAAGLTVSGIFDLRPLMKTPHNDDLRLTAIDAITASPLLWPLPRCLALDSFVGSDESFEFRRQARSLPAAWSGLGCPASYCEIAGENHFSIIAGLADPANVMTRRLVERATI